MAASRKDTLAFWESCKEDFEGSGDGAAAIVSALVVMPLVKCHTTIAHPHLHPSQSVKAVQRQVNGIDRNENLSINFDAAEWFVCTMTKQANQNQKLIQSVLRSIETKLDLLSGDGACASSVVCRMHCRVLDGAS